MSQRADWRPQQKVGEICGLVSSSPRGCRTGCPHDCGHQCEPEPPSNSAEPSGTPEPRISIQGAVRPPVAHVESGCHAPGAKNRRGRVDVRRAATRHRWHRKKHRPESRLNLNLRDISPSEQDSCSCLPPNTPTPRKPSGPDHPTGGGRAGGQEGHRNATERRNQPDKAGQQDRRTTCRTAPTPRIARALPAM